MAALLMALTSAGCFWRKHTQVPPPAPVGNPSYTIPAATNDTFTVTPEEGPNGRVASVNAALGFVVLTFPIGQVPPNDTALNVYRNGTKVGEVKITGPQREDNTVADITTGVAMQGDEVRAK